MAVIRLRIRNRRPLQITRHLLFLSTLLNLRILRRIYHLQLAFNIDQTKGLTNELFHLLYILILPRIFNRLLRLLQEMTLQLMNNPFVRRKVLQQTNKILHLMQDHKRLLLQLLNNLLVTALIADFSCVRELEKLQEAPDRLIVSGFQVALGAQGFQSALRDVSDGLFEEILA